MLYTIRRTLYTVGCTLYTIHHTLYNVRYTLYSIHYTLYTIRRTLYPVHYTLYTIQCTLYTVHCTLYTVNCTLYAIHCTAYTNQRLHNLATKLRRGVILNWRRWSFRKRTWRTYQRTRLKSASSRTTLTLRCRR